MLTVGGATAANTAGDTATAAAKKKCGKKKGSAAAKKGKCKKKKKKPPVPTPTPVPVPGPKVRATVTTSPAGSGAFVGTFFQGGFLCTGRLSIACPSGSSNGLTIAPFQTTSPTTPVTITDSAFLAGSAKELSYVFCDDGQMPDDGSVTVTYVTADGVSHTVTSPPGAFGTPTFGFAIQVPGAPPVPVEMNGQPSACD